MLLLATICLRCLGVGQRRKHLLNAVVGKCVAIPATQFSMCKISTMPLWTYSLRCWITILYLPEGARTSLWCRPVISLTTAFTSVYNRSSPCSWANCFSHHKTSCVIAVLSGLYIFVFILLQGSISILDGLISDLIRMKY